MITSLKTSKMKWPSWTIGSHHLQLCVICVVLLSNCINLSASPTRLAGWPNLRIFGSSDIYDEAHRERHHSRAASTSPSMSMSDSMTHKLPVGSLSPPLTSSQSSSPSSSPSIDISSCTGCRLRNQMKSDVNDQEPGATVMSAAEREYRIEALKKHILDALHLETPPVIKADSPTVDPSIIQKIFSESEKGETEHEDEIDHGIERSSKQLIVGVAGEVKGYDNEHKVKISFVIPNDVQHSKSIKAKLWLDVEKPSSANTRSLFVTQRLHRKYNGNPVIGVHRMNGRSSWGWIGVDLSSTLWATRETNVVLEVIPEPAQQTVNVSAGVVLEIITEGENDANRPRARRGVECQSNDASECCLQTLSISKDDLNWRWIIAPSNIRLNYCRGSCDSGTYPIYNHSSIFYAHTMRTETNSSLRMRMMPCCTPKRLGDVQMIINSGGDGIFSRTIPNLTVRECGCA